MRRPIRCICSWSVLIAVLPLFAACGSSTPTTPLTPTTPATVTDTFSGTVTINGGVTHAFGVQTGGRVTATLTALSPEDAIIGLSLGTWNGSACAIGIASDSAAKGAVVIGNVSGLGNLCVRVYDAGSLTQSTSYQVEVVHP